MSILFSYPPGQGLGFGKELTRHGQDLGSLRKDERGFGVPAWRAEAFGRAGRPDGIQDRIGARNGFGTGIDGFRRDLPALRHGVIGTAPKMLGDLNGFFQSIGGSASQATAAVESFSKSLSASFESFSFEQQLSDLAESSGAQIEASSFTLEASLVVERAVVVFDRNSGTFTSAIESTSLSLEIGGSALVAQGYGAVATDDRGSAVNLSTVKSGFYMELEATREVTMFQADVRDPEPPPGPPRHVPHGVVLRHDDPVGDRMRASGLESVRFSLAYNFTATFASAESSTESAITRPSGTEIDLFG